MSRARRFLLTFRGARSSGAGGWAQGPPEGCALAPGSLSPWGPRCTRLPASVSPLSRAPRGLCHPRGLLGRQRLSPAAWPPAALLWVTLPRTGVLGHPACVKASFCLFYFFIVVNDTYHEISRFYPF